MVKLYHFVTHTDADHVGDVLEIANHFQIGQIWVSAGSLRVPEFVERLAQIDAPVHVTKIGDTIPIFDQHLEVLYPDQSGHGENNDSIVLYGQLLGTRFLFTGDLEAEGEAALIANYPDLEIDVLKAGHHGSKGSSSQEFVTALKPKIALVSAGAQNRYGHPHQEVLDIFHQHRMQVYRTDTQGAVRFWGWQTWRIETVK